jgi:hypothetical protein
MVNSELVGVSIQMFLHQWNWTERRQRKRYGIKANRWRRGRKASSHEGFGSTYDGVRRRSVPSD